MPRITPGLTFLFSRLRTVVVLAIFIALASHSTGWQPWTLILASLFMVPLYLTIRIVLEGVSKRREAAALGARLVPVVNGKLPGNVDHIYNTLKQIESGYPGDDRDLMIEKFGTTFNIRTLWEDIIFTVEPQYIKTVLASDFPNYVKGDSFSYAAESILGTGVFNSDGDMWKFHRTMSRPFFTRDRISDFDNFNRHAMDVIGKMKTRFREGYAVDFQDAISRFTLDSATEFLFGNDVCSLAADLLYPGNSMQSRIPRKEHPAEVFARAFLEAQYVTSNRADIGWVWPLFEIFEDKSRKPMEIVNSYLEPILKEAVKKFNNAKDAKAEEGEENTTLLDHLIKETSDRTVLRDEILNILIAGRDTTASTLTFIIYCLAMHPEVLKRLRDEILTQVGPSRPPTYDDIREMKYLRAVINETLRLYPVVPSNARKSIKAAVWPSYNSNKEPIYIPSKTTVVYSVFLMHRRTDLWGPDALEFDPDRFIDERLKKYLAPNPFIFLPFNAGPRICLGQQFAYNEMSFLLTRLLQQFSSISLAIDAQPSDTLPPAEWAQAGGRKRVEKFFPKIHLTMYSHGGLWVNMGEAQD